MTLTHILWIVIFQLTCAKFALSCVSDNSFVALGNNHFISWTNNSVIGYGNSSSGQLGFLSNLDVPVTSLNFSTELLGNASVDRVGAGIATSFIVLSDGRVFGFGDNQYHQLSEEPTPLVLFTAVQPGIPWENVYGGHKFVVGISEDGNVYTWGYNQFGELGYYLPENVMWSTSPGFVSIPGNPFIYQIASGISYHVLALSADGTVYSWGQNIYGQIGNGNFENSSLPTQVVFSEPNITIISVVAGEYHSLAIGSDFSVYSWGNNEFGQLGDGTNTSRALPVKVSVPSALKVAAGSQFTAVLTKNNEIWVFGGNIIGRLGGNKDNYSPVLSGLSQQYVDILGRNELVILLSQNGQIFYGEKLQKILSMCFHHL